MAKFELILKGENNKKTFFAIPSQNQYQDISNLKVLGKHETINEALYGNSVLVFEGGITVEFEAILKPFKANLPKNASLSSYSEKAKKFIRQDRFVNPKNPKIVKIASEIEGKDIASILENSYKFVIKKLTYGKPYEGLYTYQEVLDSNVTDCGGFSTLLASILNSKGIPTRIVVGYLVKKSTKRNLVSKFKTIKMGFDDLYMHAWVEALLPNGKWFPMDASLEWRRENGFTKRTGGFGFIDEDRLVTSFGEDFRFDYLGKKYQIDILQAPISL